jgi:hypothetical protein
MNYGWIGDLAFLHKFDIGFDNPGGFPEIRVLNIAIPGTGSNGRHNTQ